MRVVLIRVVLQVGVCCLLASGAWAQRGGGHGGGGMGGGAHGGMSGGGGMGAARGGMGYSGGGSAGVSRGGYYGGGSVGATHGGYGGGSVGVTHGGYYGGGYHGGYAGHGGYYGYGYRGYGGYYGSAAYFGFGIGFGYGYPYYGGYYGYPYYGYPYVGGYWPGYSTYYPYDYGYGYAAPASTVVYAPPATQPTTVVVDHGNSGAHEYDQYGQETRSTGAPATGASPVYLFAFKDNVIRTAASYWVDGQTLHYVTLQHEERQAPLDSVDRSLTLQLNRERRVSVQLP